LSELCKHGGIHVPIEVGGFLYCQNCNKAIERPKKEKKRERS